MIKVNRREEKWREDLTIDFLLNRCKHAFPFVIVAINGKFIPKEKYKDTLIMDNDVVQIIPLIEGG